LAFPLDRETGLIREVVIIPSPDGIWIMTKWN
jgi:hypothetical protein